MRDGFHRKLFPYELLASSTAFWRNLIANVPTADIQMLHEPCPHESCLLGVFHVSGDNYFSLSFSTTFSASAVFSFVISTCNRFSLRSSAVIPKLACRGSGRPSI